MIVARAEFTLNSISNIELKKSNTQWIENKLPFSKIKRTEIS